MAKSRDRHERGLRGPLALPNSYSGKPVPVLRRQPAAAYFEDTVHDAIDRIRLACPGAVEMVDVGIAEVPILTGQWTSERVPLAAAIESTPEQHAQVVVYRRPLERRSTSRADLATLVHRTIVEQLSALTGRTLDDLDPDGYSREDD